MSRNIRPGAGAFPSRPTRRQNDDYSSDTTAYGNNNYARRSGDDDGRYSQSQRSYGGGGGGRRDEGGYGDRGGYGRSNTHSTGSTASTNSSSGSSLLDRMKVRSADTSTRTSIDEEYDTRPSGRGGGWARKPTAVQERQEEEPEPANDPNSAGNTLWGRIAAAAGSLTVNVSKAWENGINLQDGEETPPGSESRLTRAMKAYYIERARAPADLPPWLFAEHERRPQASRPPAGERERDSYNDDRAGGRQNNTPSSNRGRNYEEDDYPQPQPAKRGALRDIYDSAAATSQTKPPAGRSLAPPSTYREDDSANVSRATSRLKAFRDAKRIQPTTTGGASGGNSGRYDESYDEGGRSGHSDRGASGRMAAIDDEPYGGYGTGRRPMARSDGGGTGRPSFDEGGRRPPPRAAMGLPSRPQRGGGY